MEQAKNFVDETIKSKPVVVFSKTYCPFCVKAKNLLKDDLKVPANKMVVVELEDRPDCSDVQAYLKELTGASSVPRVFVGGKVIGGCDDTFKAHSNGSLATMISAAIA